MIADRYYRSARYGLLIGRANASKAVKAPPPRVGLWTMPGLGVE
jgi:hypothetical protein